MKKDISGACDEVHFQVQCPIKQVRDKTKIKSFRKNQQGQEVDRTNNFNLKGIGLKFIEVS